jgi:hypothetical protein
MTSRWMMRLVSTSFLLMLSSLSTAFAQIPSAALERFEPPADPHWKSIAVGDLNAAYQLLHDNHPGAADELHDSAFIRELGEAHTRALARAKTVNSYQGYLAVLAGFATELGDKHIWSRPTFVLYLPRWPQMLVSKRGDAWVVTDTELSQSRLLGASLISCDGVEVEQLARKNLGGYRAVWSIGAQQIQSAPWLFVDEGNPFITRPNLCIFDQKDQRTTVRLEWVQIKRENLLPRLKQAAGVGAAGFGVRRIGEGYWIALQDLMSDRAFAVVKSVEQQKSVLHDARFVVLDLRGNRGGSSDLGRQIAASLLGKDAVSVRLGALNTTGCGSSEVFRATTGNLEQLEYLQAQPLMHAAPDVKKMVEDEISKVRAALAHGQAFSGRTDCGATPKPPVSAQPPSLLRGRLILLTDNACFSACLAVTDDFRTLGALHVGQTTDAATWYVDVREIYLPSGYSMFSTLQAVSGDTKSVGPFEPTLKYSGDIADTAALERWISKTVVGLPRSAQAPHAADPVR